MLQNIATLEVIQSLRTTADNQGNNRTTFVVYRLVTSFHCQITLLETVCFTECLKKKLREHEHNFLGLT